MQLFETEDSPKVARRPRIASGGLRSDVFLSMATASIHDRLARPRVFVRRVYWFPEGCFVPVWADLEKGHLSAYRVEPCLFDHDLLWAPKGKHWRLRILGSREFRCDWFDESRSTKGADTARLLAKLRSDPSSYGDLLALHQSRIWTFNQRVRDNVDIPVDDASVIVLKAFHDALDRAVFQPHPTASFASVIYNLMTQRILNRCRDISRGGQMPLEKHKKGWKRVHHDERFTDEINLESTDEISPVACCKDLTRAYAELILGGMSRDEASQELQLTVAEQFDVESEIGEALGVFS